MLKITKTQDDGSVCVLKVEGKLLGVLTAELESACQAARMASGRLQLDLSGLRFADCSGIIALRNLVRQGITITAVTPFVEELLQEN